MFLGLTEVAGYYSSLTTGFEEIGVDAVLVDLSGHPFMYESDPDQPTWLRGLTVGLRRIRGGAGQGLGPRKVAWAASRAIVRAPLLVWAMFRFDAFVFVYRTTFLGSRLDLPLLRLFGKRIIFAFHGSDVRPPYLDGVLMDPDRGLDAAACARLTKKRKAELRWIERYADEVICHPSCIHLLERPVVMSLAIGLPFAPPRHLPKTSATRGETIRAVHAPSNMSAKGTERIRASITRLAARGVPVELVEILNRPHHEVLLSLNECDFVIDQLFSDTPMAGLATEAAHFGKPSIVGGYELNEIIAAEIPADLRPPSYVCHPDEIERAIEMLVTNDDARRALGARAAAFVHDQWAPAQVATRFLSVIDGTWPNSLRRAPSDINYVHGAGLDATRAAELIAGVVSVAGNRGLELKDKPTLLAAVLRSAGL